MGCGFGKDGFQREAGDSASWREIHKTLFFCPWYRSVQQARMGKGQRVKKGEIIGGSRTHISLASFSFFLLHASCTAGPIKEPKEVGHRRGSSPYALVAVCD